MKYLLLAVSLILCGCANRDGMLTNVQITHHHDFSEMVPALVFLCVIGIAASVAALIWIPIQKWIPLAGLTFFGSCIVTAWTVQWLTQWMPWIIGSGLLIGILWLLWHFRGAISAIRKSWNEPQSAPNPKIIDTILHGVEDKQ